MAVAFASGHVVQLQNVTANSREQAIVIIIADSQVLLLQHAILLPATTLVQYAVLVYRVVFYGGRTRIIAVNAELYAMKEKNAF
jgi:hypothetical protein